MIRRQNISLLKLFLLCWCEKRHKSWRNVYYAKWIIVFLLMVLWMVKTLNIFHQLFEQWSPIRHEVAFHFYETCTCAICFFVIWNVFDQMAVFKQYKCVFSRVKTQIKDKLWFRLSGLPETCVILSISRRIHIYVVHKTRIRLEISHWILKGQQ